MLRGQVEVLGKALAETMQRARAAGEVAGRQRSPWMLAVNVAASWKRIEELCKAALRSSGCDESRFATRLPPPRPYWMEHENA